jgi:hypothetical protein
VALNVDFDRWMYVSGLAPAPVRYLRVTRLNPDAKIRKLFFCASPASCDPSTQGFQPGPMSGLETGTVGTHSARFHWPAVPFHPGQPALGNVADYRIRYSAEWDVTGALIHAREKRINFSPWEKDLSAELTGLEPATTYRAQVRPEAGQPDCGAVQPGQWIEFTTVDPQESNGSDRTVRAAPPAAGLRVQPNPASGQVLVQSAAAGFTRLKVVEPATGKIIMEISVEAAQSSWQLYVGQWLPGLYLLCLEGPGMPGETARLVVVR